MLGAIPAAETAERAPRPQTLWTMNAAPQTSSASRTSEEISVNTTRRCLQACARRVDGMPGRCVGAAGREGATCKLPVLFVVAKGFPDQAKLGSQCYFTLS